MFLLLLFDNSVTVIIRLESQMFQFKLDKLFFLISGCE